MTDALYLADSYLRECDAVVASVIDGGVVLDQTIFYPRGGGQPSDTGKLMAAGKEFKVVNVMKKDGAIVHELEGGASGLVAGSSVHCVLDWERRYPLMRMHTAAHVLGSIMHNELGAQITGNQLEADKARFDFNLAEFDRAKFDAAVAKANDALSKQIEVKSYSLPREEAMRIPGVVKLAGALPPSISELRIVEIPGIDIQADGGTHVRELREVGRIEVIKLENKGKENRRIYFTLTR
jgi:Ser-tRNA(Ala) deacylase AlaX